MSTAPKISTYADLQALPETVVGELVAGQLIVSPRPAIRHAKVASLLNTDIGSQFGRDRGGPGGWWILFEPELHLGGDVLVPDLAGWRRERMPELSADAFMTVSPDWVCEIASPSTARFDRKTKLPIYAREKVDHLWIVDPDIRTLEVFSRVNSHWLWLYTFSDDDIARAVPFEAVDIALADFWIK